jgi:hypothetical protein
MYPLLSNAFTSVTIILFFFSVIFASGITKAAESRHSWKSVFTLVAVDAFAVYVIVSGQTSTGIHIDGFVIILAAGFSNALYAYTAANK